MKTITIIMCILAFTLTKGVSFARQKENANPIVSSKDIAYLKNKYTSEEINYFHEINFFLEKFVDGEKGSSTILNAKPSHRLYSGLHKWDRTGELYIGIDEKHNIWDDDRELVENAVNELNTLGLPFKLIIRNHFFKSRIIFFFRDSKYIKRKYNIESADSLITGLTKVSVTRGKGKAFAAIINIYNNDFLYGKMSPEISKGIRQYVILQELTQALGPSGDSWHYKNSAFSDDIKTIEGLCDIDRRIVQMLYEACIPLGYRRAQFEQDFADILYHIDAPQKIADYMQTNNIPLSLLETARSYIKNDRENLIKLPTYAYVKLNGDYTEKDIEFIEKTVKLINAATDKFQLEITESELLNQTPCLRLNFEDTPLSDIASCSWNRHTDTDYMFPWISGFDFVQKRDEKLYLSTRKNQDTNNKMVFRMLYPMILSLDSVIDEDVIDISEDGELSFRPGYREMLTLLYEPVFWSGMPVSELDEAIRILREEK